ncbi:MAG: transcription antitermination factor NusB [Nitrospinales bacterium]
MGKRRRSRELALKFLYQFELNKGDLAEQLPLFIERESGDDETGKFAVELVRSTIGRKKEIDALLEKCAANWTLDRMAVIDRNILRMAACELLFHKDIPPKVTIDEALEIAKKYGDADSSEFINGVLDQIKNEAEKESPSAAV